MISIPRKRPSFFNDLTSQRNTDTTKTDKQNSGAIKSHPCENGEADLALQAQLAQSVQKQEIADAKAFRNHLGTPSVTKSGQFSQSTTTPSEATPTTPTNRH